MGFRDEFRGSGRTYAEWSLENTTETGLRTNSEQLKGLKLAVKSTFDEGITRVVQSQEALADSLRDELAYQAEQICQEVQRSSEQVVDAIQQMADYLGAGLSEVRWAVERHTRVSEATLRLLLSSLSNESRQYWEQGVACYETKEYELAKERLQKALEANRTNSFAYEYLGFISVDEDNAEAAIRNFDLARKFSKSNHHRAIALSHLARSSHAAGNLRNAVDFSKAAVEADPQTAKFWYEYGTYCARSGDVASAIAPLREAIQRDWNYWGVIAVDSDLDCIRKEITKLFEELRLRERRRASEALEQLRAAIERSKHLSGDPVSAPCVERLRTLEKKLSEGNVHLYREIQSESPQAAQYAYRFANDALVGKNRDLTSSLNLSRENLRKLNEESFAGFGFLCALGVACIAFITISMLFSSDPERKGPFRVFTASQNMQINATREQIASGSSRRVMSENGDQITIRLDNGDRTLPRADLLKVWQVGDRIRRGLFKHDRVVRQVLLADMCSCRCLDRGIQAEKRSGRFSGCGKHCAARGIYSECDRIATGGAEGD
jgi:tetratricopeptide (TPR) repeat protein